MTYINAADSATGNLVQLRAIGLRSGTVRFPESPIVGVGVYDSHANLVGSFELTTEDANILGEELRKAAEAASKEDN